MINEQFRATGTWFPQEPVEATRLWVSYLYRERLWVQVADESMMVNLPVAPSLLVSLQQQDLASQVYNLGMRQWCRCGVHEHAGAILCAGDGTLAAMGAVDNCIQERMDAAYASVGAGSTADLPGFTTTELNLRNHILWRPDGRLVRKIPASVEDPALRWVMIEEFTAMRVAIGIERSTNAVVVLALA